MQMTPRFRPLRSNDREQISKFFSLMGEESSGFFNVDHGNEIRVNEFFENGKKDHLFYVFELDGEIIGLTFLWDIDRTVPKMGIAVRDDVKGQGVGGRFLDSLLSNMRRDGYAGVILTTAVNNLRAQRLYQSRGYERLGIAENDEFIYIKRFEK